jgi:hemerythrin
MGLEWKDVYEIGHAEIDDQHEELFGRVNDFLMAADTTSLTISALEMYRYTRNHFGHEEDLMRQIRYPATATHIERHNHLISRLNEVSRDIAKGTLDLKDLEVFLSDWLLVHISVYDKKLAAYVAHLEPPLVCQGVGDSHVDCLRGPLGDLAR